MKNNSFTSWKASDNPRFTLTPRVRPPTVKLGQWRSRGSDSPTASHLEEEPSDMALTLGKEEIERTFQARYEQSILKDAIGRQQQSFNHSNRRFGPQQRYTKGRRSFHKSFFGRSKDQLHTEVQSSNQSQ
ncbi:uncharacterized protein RHIMIDRAFT_276137 [Rhizopus microsporus ATCC 52813]|uniref:Uncharacterized protein n=1 Tax=Rhizopus microsporus ATCC 52813 TaxID=1340429 RepID=A0A2G4T264_RHIZD|nr:uncharacterized protein RHIMIDRAFT_276137 [Rhizopus microsporus ATCC 52813]PHZ14756.1 hypothetical protein RHIMIDRAFT_276137 [Rhizopus microsporus ATCC 52813]